MTIEETITRELSAAMQAERFLYPRDHSLIHASAIGQCRRQQGYELIQSLAEEMKRNPQVPVSPPLAEKLRSEWMGVESLPQDSHFLSICDIGHGVHHQIQSRLVNVLGWCKQENIELEVWNDQYGIIGHIDALSEPLVWNCCRPDRFEPDSIGERYIIDIKSHTSRPYIKAEPDTGNIHHIEPSGFDKLRKIKKEHLLQVNLYAWMLREMGIVDELPRLLVIYIAKDTDSERYSSDDPDRHLALPYKVFVEDADPEVIETALKRARHIWKRVKAGELPGKDHWHSSENPVWQCRCCSFRKECLPEYFGNAVIQLTDASKGIIKSYAG